MSNYYSPAVKTVPPNGGGLVGSWDEEPAYRGRAPDRQSPEVLRSRSAEGRAQIVSPDIRRTRHRSPSPYGRAVPPPRPSPFRYNLPPSEPIYHDIEQERSRQAAQSLSPAYHASEYEHTAGFVYPPQSATPRLSEQVYSRAARTQPTKTDDKPEMIMFSDAFTDTGSVLTGWSEQELIQKQQKEQKRREKHKYGKKKKKKESRIMNMPRITESPDKESSPSRGKYVKSRDDYPEVPDESRQEAEEGKAPRFLGLMSRAQKRTVPLADGSEERRERSRWRLMQSRSSEEQDSTYNDSSHASSAVPEVDNDVSYASLPIDTARPGGTMQVIQKQTGEEWRKNVEEEDVSWDDEEEEEEEPLAPGAFPVRPSDLSSRRPSSRPRDVPAEKPRAVRFGEHTEYSYSEDRLDNQMPFDESNEILNHVSVDEDQESPISVMSVQNIDQKSAGTELPHSFSPEKKHKVYPKAMYPKSILRNRGGNRPGEKQVYYDGVTAKEQEGSNSWDSPTMPNTARGMMADSALSPAINPSFSDSYGSQLSPIRSAPSADNFSGSWLEPEAAQDYEDDDMYSEGVDFIEAVASVVIQTAIRRHLAKIAVEKRRAAVVARDDMPQFENMATHMFDLAAIQIQAIFRGWWVRDCLSVDNYCATRIQKAVRGYMCRMSYLYDVYRIIMVQSIWRRNIGLNTSGQRLANVIAIQSVFRGYLIRRGHANYEDRAATRIQSAWRAYDAQMYYLSDLAAILIVQSVFRRWFVQTKIVPYAKARPLGTSDCLILDEHSRSREEIETPVLYHPGARAPSCNSLPFDESKEILPEEEQQDKSGGDMLNLDKVKARNKREMSKIKMSSEAASFWKTKSNKSVASRALDAKLREVGKAAEAYSGTAKKIDTTKQGTAQAPVEPVTSHSAAAVIEVVQETEESVEVVALHEKVPQPSAHTTKGLSVSDLLTQEEVRAMHEREKSETKMSSEAANFWKSMSKKKPLSKKPEAPSESEQKEGSPTGHVEVSAKILPEEAVEGPQKIATSSVQVDLGSSQSQNRQLEIVESADPHIASACSHDAQSQNNGQPDIVHSFERPDERSALEEKDGHDRRPSAKMSSEAKDFWKNMGAKKSVAASSEEKAPAETREQPPPPPPVEELAVATILSLSYDADDKSSPDNADEERPIDEVEEIRQKDEVTKEDAIPELPSTPKRVKTTKDTETQTSPQRSVKGDESPDEIQQFRGATTPLDETLLVNTTISRQDTNVTDEIARFRRDTETPEPPEQIQDDSTVKRVALGVDVATETRADSSEAASAFEAAEVQEKDNVADLTPQVVQTTSNEPKGATEDASPEVAVEETEPTPLVVADIIPASEEVMSTVAETGLTIDGAPELDEERQGNLSNPTSADEDNALEISNETPAKDTTLQEPTSEGKEEGTSEMTEGEDKPEDKPIETKKASPQKPDSRRADMMKKLMLIKAMQEAG